MPMLRFISKGSIALLVALLVGGCRGNAHTQDEDAAGFVYRGLYTFQYQGDAGADACQPS